MHRPAFVIGLFFLFTSSAVADPKKDLAAMTGKWRPSAMQVGDNKMPDEQVKRILLEMDGEKYTVTVDGEGKDKGTIKLGVMDKLKTIDIVSSEGPNKDKTMLAIYELDGDTFKVCYALEGSKRPTEFKAADEKTLLATYKRVKK